MPSRHNLRPFMVAVLKGYVDLCKLLLKLNCRLDGRYQTSKTALQVDSTVKFRFAKFRTVTRTMVLLKFTEEIEIKCLFMSWNTIAIKY